MPQKRFGQYVRDLSFDQKLVFFGSLFCVVSVFLPWYQDTDQFGSGYQFLGITGPLYLVGVLFLVSGLTSLGSLFNTKVREKITDFGIKISHFHIVSCAFLIFLLVLTNSVYFHEKFGVNIISKDMRYGMIFAFVGVGLLLFGGLTENKSRRSDDLFDEPRDSTEIKPLIDYPERKHQDVLNRDIPEFEKEEQGKIEL